ncbi:MAG: RNA methyltransferase [Chlamydiia bacterium]|nr:RNA methyltransferase [Chlamydiia bacterium]
MISSLYNPIVKHLVKLRQNHDYREEQDSILICGATLIDELSKTFTPKLVLTKKEVTEEILQKISGLKTFSDAVAEFSLPKPKQIEKQKWILVFDAVSDPGNMGTLLRTALAFGWEAAYFLDHTVDPFNDKVIRSSRGALFYLPFSHGTLDDLKKFSHHHNLPILVADTRGKPLLKSQPKKGALLVVSNEAHGPCKKLSHLGETISIPMTNNVESLNVGVAGSILLYHLKHAHER